jgi:hypothetical protein
VNSGTEKQKPLPDIDELVGTLTVQPAPFEATIVPRSEKKAQLIRETWRDTEENLLDKQTLQWKEIPKGMLFSTWLPEKIDI